MLSRIRIAIELALVVTLLFTFPVFAGGWAVITLDELPSNVVAGEPISVGFTVLQHGITPMAGLYPQIIANMPSAEPMIVSAQADGKPGHYAATLTFPREGDWEWTVQAFTMEQPMPVLNVAPAGTASANQPATKTGLTRAAATPLLLLRVIAFGLAVLGLVFAFRSRNRLTGALAGLCLLVGVGTFMTGAATSKVEAQGKELSKLSVSEVELGRQLFIAKGCITCHYNTKAADRSDYWTIEMGAPDLSNFTASPEVLEIRLKDPKAAKSDTKMPNLGLKQTEIEALIAFINSK
jgi:cytochrome c2